MAIESCGGEPIFWWRGYGTVLPDGIHRDPVIKPMKECAIAVGGLMNDIFSSEKELRVGQRFNFINISMEQTGRTFAQQRNSWTCRSQ